jgi:flagellar protein FlaG
MSAAISSTTALAAAMAGDIASTRANAAGPSPAAAVASATPVAASMVPSERSVQFHVDSGTGLTVISVVDRATGEVVRQIPEDVMIRIARYLDAELGGGNAIDTSA